MFSKVTAVTAALVITTVVTAIAFQIREGLGDDNERSVLVREQERAAPATPTESSGNRYAEPRTFAEPAPIRSGDESAGGSLSDSPAPRYDDSPRTASRSTLVDRLRNREPVNGASSGGAASSSSDAPADVIPSRKPAVIPTRKPGSLESTRTTGDEVVPFRRPGGLRNRTAAPMREEAEQAPTNEIPSRRPEGVRAPAITSSPIGERSNSIIDNPSMSQPETPQPKAPGVSVLMQSAGPMVMVDTVGPQAIQIGKPATYKVRVANAGAADADEIMIRVQLPASAQILSNQPSIGESQIIDNADGTVRIDWRLDQLASRGEEQMEVTIAAQDRSPLAMKLEWTTRPRQAMAQIEVQEPELDVNVVGPRTVMFGRTEVYTVTVSNPGNGPAENVVLDVALGGGPSESKKIGIIPAGGREVIKLELTAGDAGEMPILAAVRGDGGLTHEFEHIVVVRRAKLGLTLDGPGLKYAGSSATYSITVRNDGDAAAESVEAVIQLPSGAKYLGGLTGAEQKLQKLGWRVGTLQPGDERTYRIRCDLTVAGENRLNAVTSAADQLQSSAVFVTRVESIADLKLFVNDPQGPQAIGEEVEYEITVLNRGTKSAANVSVIAHFAEGVEPTGAEGLGYELGDGQVVFKSIPRVSPGQKIVLKVRAKANNGGDHRFRAEVRCDNPHTQLSAEETTRYFGDERAASTARRP